MTRNASGTLKSASGLLAKRKLSAAAALIATWILLGVVHAGLLGQATADLPLRWGHRIQLLDFAAFQLAALGVLSAGVVSLWKHVPWRSRRLDRGLLVMVVSAVALPLLEDDLSNMAARAGHSLLTWQLVGGIAIGLGSAAAVELGRFGARRGWRGLGVIVAATLPIGSNLVLAGDYPVLQLATAWIAACICAASLTGVELGFRVGRRSRVALTWLFVAVSITSLAIRPGNRVWAILVSAPGSTVAPLTARIFAVADIDDGAEPTENEPGAPPAANDWLSPRDKQAAIPPSGPPLVGDDGIVLLLTIDALRADVLVGDAHRAQLPTLTMLRDEGVNFLDARAPSPSTGTSYISMMLGKYYSQLFWTQSKKAVNPRFRKTWGVTDDETRSFAEELADAGTHTVQVVGVHGTLYEIAGVRGFVDEVRIEKHHAPAEMVADHVIEQLRDHRDRQTFLYTHFIDPHSPYRGDPDLEPFERYLGEVAAVDSAIGRIVAFLKREQMWSRTTLIVSADHGEAFGERGLRYHASTVHDAMLRIPLIVRSPKQGHRDIAAPVSLIDVGPTVLDMFGLSTPGHNMGQSLAPFVRGRDAALTRPIAVDSGRHMQALYFADGMKAIRNRRRKTQELYDLRTDPDELDNLIDEAPDAQQRLGVLNAFFATHAFKRQGYELPWRRF